MDENDKLVATHASGGVKIVLAALGPFGGVINEVINMIQADMLERRLQSTEKYIREFVSFKGLSFEKFTSGIENLSEHDYYVVRKSFKHLVMEAQPETVEVLCKAMVDYSLGTEQDINQIVCEVLGELNSYDIKLLLTIKRFINTEKHTNNTRENTNKTRENQAVNNGKRLSNRDIVHGKNTIMWEEFSKKIKKDETAPYESIPAYTALNNSITVERVPIYIFAQDVISLIKMESLGIVETEYTSTLGTSSHLNIQRFHITILGRKILDYIDIEEGEK